MGAILYDFHGIPENPTEGEVAAAAAVKRTFNPDGSPTLEFAAAVQVLARRHAFVGIYGDLARLGHAGPEQLVETISRGEMVSYLQTLMGGLVRAVLDTNADGLYNEEDDAVSAKAFSEHRADAGGKEIHSDLSKVLMGFPYAPNILTADDITAAFEG